MDEITVKQWQKVDRRTMETVTLPLLPFLDKLCEQLQNIVPHSFIAEQQAAYLKHRKSIIATNVVICDFSENYSFVIQDALQGFHWSNAKTGTEMFFVPVFGYVPNF